VTIARPLSGMRSAFLFRIKTTMKRSLIALALAAVLPISAQAGEISYSYVEGGYNRADGNGGNADGYFLDGSVSFSDDWYGAASYRKLTNNDLGIDVSLDETVLNLGYRHAMSDKADFIAEVGYVNIGADVEGMGSDSSDGYRVAAGFRGMLAPRFEGNVKAYYTKVSDLGDGEFGVRVGGVYNVNQTWGIVASYDHAKIVDESLNTRAVGVRASF
jgi:hypothetical protein